MKKRLYWIIFASFTAFFLFFIILLSYLYGYDIVANFNKDLFINFRLVLIILISILLISFAVRYIILREIIKPVDSFITYVSKIILNDPKIKDLDKNSEQEVMDIIEDHGHDTKEIKKGLKRLIESSSVRREFSANVTHELKSPLTSINGFAEMIAMGIAKDEEAREFALRINKEGNRLLKMIDETIELSRIDNHYIRTESFLTFNISNLIKENVESLSLLAKDRNVKINYNIKDVNFYGNSKLIYDLIRNLISNAIKYSSGNNSYLNIDIIDKPSEVRLIFTDNGIGIAEEDKKRIFERFYVVDKSRGNKTGTGLGLSLVKNIVKLHRGKVLLDSNLGEGSIFTIILPKLSKKDYD